jgi:hypothetical protein
MHHHPQGRRDGRTCSCWAMMMFLIWWCFSSARRPAALMCCVGGGQSEPGCMRGGGARMREGGGDRPMTRRRAKAATARHGCVCVCVCVCVDKPGRRSRSFLRAQPISSDSDESIILAREEHRTRRWWCGPHTHPARSLLWIRRKFDRWPCLRGLAARLWVQPNSLESITAGCCPRL